MADLAKTSSTLETSERESNFAVGTVGTFIFFLKATLGTVYSYVKLAGNSIPEVKLAWTQRRSLRFFKGP